MNPLQTLFLSELVNLYEADRRSVTLPKMTEATTIAELKTTIEEHLKQSEGHSQKVERIFEYFDRKTKEVSNGDEIKPPYSASASHGQSTDGNGAEPGRRVVGKVTF